MENNFDKQWEAIRSRAEECPLSDKELLRRVRKAVDTVTVRRWGWLPYLLAMSMVTLAMTTLFYTGIVVPNNSGYDMATHNITPSAVVAINNIIWEKL